MPFYLPAVKSHVSRRNSLEPSQFNGNRAPAGFSLRPRPLLCYSQSGPCYSIPEGREKVIRRIAQFGLRRTDRQRGAVCDA